MHEPVPPSGAYPPPAHYTGRWRHDLANEINALTMAASAARHMLELGNLQAALANLARAEESGMRCIDIVRHLPPER